MITTALVPGAESNVTVGKAAESKNLSRCGNSNREPPPVPSHEWMMKFLEHRIADKRILRLIRKWLRAGVSEDGEWSQTTIGTPQGAVISPRLANIYLHDVLDLWVKQWRGRHARGDVLIHPRQEPYESTLTYGSVAGGGPKGPSLPRLAISRPAGRVSSRKHNRFGLSKTGGFDRSIDR
jgi:hypothetical protein